MNNQELYHYGVLGMRWGVRRTPEQLARSRKSKTDGWSEDAKTAHELKKKSVGQMSNAELRKLTERQQLEINYSRLNPGHIKRGMMAIGGVAAGLGTVAGLVTNGSKIIRMGKKVAGKFIKAKG